MARREKKVPNASFWGLIRCRAERVSYQELGRVIKEIVENLICSYIL